MNLVPGFAVLFLMLQFIRMKLTTIRMKIDVKDALELREKIEIQMTPAHSDGLWSVP